MSLSIIRRCWEKRAIALLTIVLAPGSLQAEPLEIGMQGQFFVDDYLVDNRYALRELGTKLVIHHYHVPRKYEGNPVIDEDMATHPSVRFDKDSRMYKMWYVGVVPLVVGGGKEVKGQLTGRYHVRYAESKDGLHWVRPKLGLYELNGSKDNNICFAHPKWDVKKVQGERRTIGYSVSSAFLLEEDDMPAKDRRGYKYLMSYALRGGGPRPEDKDQVWIVGSHDGIHWDRDNQWCLGMAGMSDGWFGAVYDSERKKYVAHLRPRDRYHAFQPVKQEHHNGFAPRDFVYAGTVRRVGKVESDSLDRPWNFWAKTVMLPDETDRQRGAMAHMGIGMRYYEGIYWGYLIPYIPKTIMWSELVTSRDGDNFNRTHSIIIPPGSADSWDAVHAWAPRSWLEVGDEWWIYYFGTDRPPNTPFQTNTKWGVGIAKIRKEGFVSIRTPDVGGLIVTKLINWPGGNLNVNCSVPRGEMRVRVSDLKRHGIDGFDFNDCQAFSGDSTAHQVKWKGRSLDELKGSPIRLEFYFSSAADIYSFRARSE